MRTIEDMRKFSEQLVADGTSRDPAVTKPTPTEMRLANDNLRLVLALYKADKLIAYGFIPDWKAIKDEIGLK